MRRIAIALACLAIVVVAFTAPAGALPTCTRTAAANGDWSAPATWGGAAAPASTDHVCVPAGRTVTLTGPATVQSLQVGGTLTIGSGTLTLSSTTDESQLTGTLAGAGTLEVSGPMSWTGGYMTGSGTTKVLAGAVLTHQTNFVNMWDTRRLEVAGTLRLATASRGISRSGDPVIAVASTGLVENTSAGAVTVGPVVHNAGRVESAGSGSVLELDTGGGAGSSDGDFGTAGSQGTVRFDGSTAHRLADGARFLGGVEIAGGVTIPDGTTVSASGANRESGSGDLQGAGTLEIGGTFAWTGGYMTDGGTTKVLAGAVLTQQTNFVNMWDTRRLENAGTIVLATADRGISQSGTPSIHNLAGATIRKTGGGTSTIGPVVENDGTIDVSIAGATLGIRGGTASDALWGSRDRVSSGSFGGVGTVRLESGASGRFALGAGAGFPGSVTLASGTLAIPAGVTVTSGGPFALTGGLLDGDGSLALTAASTWTGGDMAGGGTTTVGPGATLALPSAGGLELGGTRRLLVDGVLDAAADNTIFDTFGSSPLVHVRAGGVLRKSAGDNWTFVDVPLRNDGTVEGLAGELRLERGTAAPHTGAFKSASAADFVALTGEGHVLAASADLQDHTRIAGDVTVRDGDTLALDDDVVQTGGELSGDVAVTGTLTWSGGSEANGTTTVAVPGRIVVEPEAGDTCASASLGEGRRMDVAGLLQIRAGSDLYTFGDDRPEIHNTGRIEIDSGGGTCGAYAGIVGDGLVANAPGATIEKLGGAGDSQVSNVDNDGTVVNSAAGLLRLDSNAAIGHAGAFESTGSGAIAFDYGDFVLDQGATLDGNMAVTGADVRVPEGVAVVIPPGRMLAQSSGSITGAGDLRIDGALEWTGGYQEGAGSTLVEPGGTVTVAPADGDDQAFAAIGGSRSLVNRGAMTVDDGYFEIRDGASILNRGTLELRGETELEGYSFGSGFDSLVHNTGTLRKTGASAIDVRVPVDNDGTVEVQDGSLELFEIVNWSGFGYLGETGIVGGDYLVRGTLVLPDEMTANAARLELDGAASKVVHRAVGGGQADSLTGLARNAAGGTLVLRGGRSLTVDGAFANQGVLDLGAGSTLTTKGFRQTAGGVLRPAVTAGGTGRVASSGSAQLGGRLDTPASPLAGDHLVLSAPSVTSSFAAISGGYAASVSATEVRLRPPGAGLQANAAPADTLAPASVDEPAAASWQRRRAELVTSTRGTTVAVRGVRGRELALVARTCRRCGAVRVRWAGRARTVSLARRSGRRTIRVFRLDRVRRGTVRLTATSARRVAVRALLIRR